MLVAHFKSKKLGKYLILEVKGHAGADDIGKDLVCASASMLAYTLAQCSIDMYNDGKLLKKPTIKFKDGFAAIVCKPTKEAYAECLHCFHVAQVGFNLLQQNYQENVRLIPFGSGL